MLSCSFVLLVKNDVIWVWTAEVIGGKGGGWGDFILASASSDVKGSELVAALSSMTVLSENKGDGVRRLVCASAFVSWSSDWS